MKQLIFSLMFVFAQEDDPVASLPEGKEKDLIVTVCVQCHTLKTAVGPRKTADAWKNTVYDMISRGAQIFPEEADVIIQYLSKYRGASAAQNKTVLQKTPAALSLRQ